MKLLTVAVPCYNSQDYLPHCVETLLAGGEDLEILIVDDGSTDRTGAVAEAMQRAHPEVIRVIHQENRGHGGAVMTGLRCAAGLYFRVVDSDDWVDAEALRQVMATLAQLADTERPTDLLVSNYIYDKAGAARKKVIRYRDALPRGKVIGWEATGRFRKGEYMLMHSLTYRTALLRDCGLCLPEHTFYVDNLFAYTPLAAVETLYYLDVDLYHYCIGREDQSVQEATMIRRIDQQLRVNRMMLEQVELSGRSRGRQRGYLYHYLEIVTAVSTILLIRAGTAEHLRKREELWQFIRRKDPQTYRRLRRGAMGILLNLPGRAGRGLASAGYEICRKLFGFN